MNTKSLLLTASLATALVTGASAFAQDTVQATPAAAPAAAAPSEFVYTPKLPTVAELNAQAAAQNISITRIDQTSDKVVVTYKYANGAAVTVAYMALPAGSEAPVVAPAAVPAPAPAPATTTTTVVYSAPYYYGAPYYWNYWPPVAVNVGWGWGWGWHGGGWRGGPGWHR